MNGYERVSRAMHFKSVDKAPLRHVYSRVGFYEHGDKLNDLFATLPCDFLPYKRHVAEQPLKEDFDKDGTYHAFKKDEWGTTWEHRIFGVAGIPCDHALKTQEDAENFRVKHFPKLEGPEFEAFKAQMNESKDAGLYAMTPWLTGLYERMIALYGDENVLCDMFMDEKGINNVADELSEFFKMHMIQGVRAGANGVFYGDDYGSERSLIMGPDCWRKFIKPRLKKIFEPAISAGLDIHFHSCGNIWDILPDLKEIGVTSIWPQIPAYNMEELAKKCRELQLAVEIHTDRARTMTYGTPQQVKDLVKREFDTFKMMDGGSWFYIEVDNDFPYENVEALVQTIAEYR